MIISDKRDVYLASHWSSAFAYIYLLRTQITVGAVLLLFPIVAVTNWVPGLRQLFENFFYLDRGPAFFSALTAILVGWSLVFTSRIVLLNGAQRFGIRGFVDSNELDWKVWLIPLIFSASTLVATIARSEGIGWTVAAGTVAGYVVAYFALWLAVLFSPPESQPRVSGLPFISWADQHTISPDRLIRKLADLWCRLPEDFRAGYLDDRGDVGEKTNAGHGLPWASHWLAFFYACLTFLIYVLIYVQVEIYLHKHASDNTDFPMPALAMVLLLLLNIHWALSGLAFFLDRFRVPLLTMLGLFALVGAFAPWSDRYYQVRSTEAIPKITPADALRQRVQENRPIIIVTTAGGGIQAAAWTTEVLTSLQHESLAWKHGSFADSVALISSVSGGSTGALFFLNQYASKPGSAGFQLTDDGKGFQKLVREAAGPALDDVAWALVYCDLPSLLGITCPGKLLDRGRMLELAWQRRTGNSQYLSAWRDGVKEGWRPAVIFNATMAETGEPFLLSNTDFEEQSVSYPGAPQPSRETFYGRYSGFDLPVVTAVRLGASFPYVSPAARADTGSKASYHIIDGGYYDNYGVASVVEWIEEAFRGLEKQPDVLVIQIRSFPNDAIPAARPRGWFFQAYAPLDGLLSVRSAAQLIRDRDDLLLLQQRWQKGTIRFAQFEFPSDNAPLSWKMNPAQISAVEAAWSKQNPNDIQQVHCMFDAQSGDCAKLAGQKP